MKRFISLVCLVLAFGVFTFAGTISIQPSATTLPLGSLLPLDVNVSGVSDLYAWQFDIAFNPAVLSANNVTEGGLFSSVGVFFSPGSIDNAAGTITFIGDSLSGPGPGISTNGTLAQISFTSIGSGNSGIDLANVILLDSGLNDVAATSSGAEVTVTATPEPGSILLLVTGIGVGCFLKRRRSAL